MNFKRIRYEFIQSLLANTDTEQGALFLVDKPKFVTSYEIVHTFKSAYRRLGIKKLKIGHAGTLDPLASGLLLLCVGKNTKSIPQLQDLPKTYSGIFLMGMRTPSFDLETEVEEKYPTEHITLELLDEARRRFLGKIEQFPPIYSAVKFNGKRAYDLARSGEKELALSSRVAEVFSFDLFDFKMPELGFRIKCSKGTYIRSIANDFGIALGNGACLGALIRESIGDYKLENAIRIPPEMLF